MVTYDKITEAYNRIFPYIIKTPIIRLEQLDEIVGCRAFVKAENMQVTHSFKIRGSLNKIIKDKDLLKMVWWRHLLEVTQLQPHIPQRFLILRQ